MRRIYSPNQEASRQNQRLLESLCLSRGAPDPVNTHCRGDFRYRTFFLYDARSRINTARVVEIYGALTTESKITASVPLRRNAFLIPLHHHLSNTTSFRIHAYLHHPLPTHSTHSQLLRYFYSVSSSPRSTTSEHVPALPDSYPPWQADIAASSC
jgi:hypothetical protein